MKMRNIALPAIDTRTGDSIIVYADILEVDVVIEEYDTDYVDGYAEDFYVTKWANLEGEEGVDFVVEKEKALEWLSNDDQFREKLLDEAYEYMVCEAEARADAAQDR